jgi:uncharacterized protein GlcG (DUF336 family)
MAGAPVVGIEVAQDKAFTALFGVPSGHFHTAVKDDPTLLGGLLRIPRIAISGGGLPIRIGDRVVGGIGVSGGSVEEDVSSAQAGLDAVRTHHAQESVDSPEGHTSKVADPVR